MKARCQNGSEPAHVRGGFTLLELLVVIAIIGLIVAVVTPSAASLMRGSQLTQGALMVGEQLHKARQLALSKNRPVEVRFYQYGDAGEQAAGSGSYFRALQLFEVQETGSFSPLGKVTRIPDSVIIDGGATLSSLIGEASASSKPALAAGSTLNVPLPRVGTQYNSVSFRFLPGGATDLPKTPGAAWFLTLHELKDGDRLSPVPPSNFFTIQVDPFNGHVKNHRP